MKIFFKFGAEVSCGHLRSNLALSSRKVIWGQIWPWGHVRSFDVKFDHIVKFSQKVKLYVLIKLLESGSEQSYNQGLLGSNLANCWISAKEMKWHFKLNPLDVKFSKKYFCGHSGSKLTIFRISLKALKL